MKIKGLFGDKPGPFDKLAVDPMTNIGLGLMANRDLFGPGFAQGVQMQRQAEHYQQKQAAMAHAQQQTSGRKVKGRG